MTDNQGCLPTAAKQRRALHPEKGSEFRMIMKGNKRLIRQKRYFMEKNPPTSSSVNMSVKRLKYLSMNALIGLPNFQIKPATRKNLAVRLAVDAITNSSKFISKAPAEIVKIL